VRAGGLSYGRAGSSLGTGAMEPGLWSEARGSSVVGAVEAAANVSELGRCATLRGRNLDCLSSTRSRRSLADSARAYMASAEVVASAQRRRADFEGRCFGKDLGRGVEEALVDQLIAVLWEDAPIPSLCAESKMMSPGDWTPDVQGDRWRPRRQPRHPRRRQARPIGPRAPLTTANVIVIFNFAPPCAARSSHLCLSHAYA
jgi:hypothetical protein